MQHAAIVADLNRSTGADYSSHTTRDRNYESLTVELGIEVIEK